MKPVLFLILLSVSFCLGAGTSTPIRVNDNDWPPYFFGGQEGAPKGIAKELLQHCLDKTEFEFKFSFYPINRMHRYMETGELDINIYSFTQARTEFLVYGKEPLFTAGYRPFVRKGEVKQIESINDFDALLLGHLHGLRYSDDFRQYIEARRENGQLVIASDTKSLLNLLVHKRIDVFVSITDTVWWEAKSNNLTGKIKFLDFDVKTSEYFVTLSKRSTRIKDKTRFMSNFDRCIKSAKESGLHQAILKKYKF